LVRWCMVHIIIWVHKILNLKWIKTRFVIHEWVNEFKIHLITIFGQTLRVVFYKQVQLLYVMAYYIIHVAVWYPHLSLHASSLQWCLEWLLTITTFDICFHLVINVFILSYELTSKLVSCSTFFTGMSAMIS
jgi:hypothetical protein